MKTLLPLLFLAGLSLAQAGNTALSVNSVGTVQNTGPVNFNLSTTQFQLNGTTPSTSAAAALGPATNSAGGVANYDSTGHLILPSPYYPQLHYSNWNNIIIDSDDCADRDDTMAILEACELQTQGECTILGAIADVKQQYTAPAIAATLQACGLGYVPVGSMTARAITPVGTVGQSVATGCPGYFTQRSNNGLLYGIDSTTLYRQLLAYAPASSVKIVCIGSESALYLLSQSSADFISPLTGLQLINQKVAEIDVMGGAYPSSASQGPSGNPEYNFALDPASDAVFAAVSVPINFIGFQMGFAPANDYCLSFPTTSPGYISRIARGSNADIYDPVAILYAVRGASFGGTTYFTSTAGTNAINTSTGANAFTAGAGTQTYLSYGGGGSAAVDAVLQTLITLASETDPSNPYSLIPANNTWTGTQTFSGPINTGSGGGGLLYLPAGNNPVLAAPVATMQIDRTATGSSNYAVVLYSHGAYGSTANDWSTGMRGSDTSNFHIFRESGSGGVIDDAGDFTLSAGQLTVSSGTITDGTLSGLLQATNGTINTTGVTPNAGAVAALGKTTNSPGGIAVQDANGAFVTMPLFGIGPSATAVLCEGDSTTAGAGVTDPRQTYPCILSTLPFPLNASSVYNWGWSGYTTFSINALNSTAETVTFWTGGALASSTASTSPSAIAAPYVIVYAGTNDYFGVYLNATLSTSSTTITGLSRNYYFTDFAGHNRAIAIGDAVTGTGIPVGTTVASIVSGSSIMLSQTPTVAGTQLLTFTPSPTTSTFHTDLANLISNAHTANGSAKVVVCTLPPANNTTAPADGVDSQGDFQANRLVYNSYIRGLTIGGGGSNPDYILDLANIAEFQSFNASYFNADQLHPNFAGDQILARATNRALLSFVTPSYYALQTGSECVPDTWLSNNVALLNATNTFTSATSIGSTAVSDSTTLSVYSTINVTGSVAGGVSTAAINMNAASGGTTNIQMQKGGVNTWLLKGDASSPFNITDSANGGGIVISSNPQTNGVSTSGPLSMTNNSTSNGFSQSFAGGYTYNFYRNTGDGTLILRGSQTGNIGFDLQNASSTSLFKIDISQNVHMGGAIIGSLTGLLKASSGTVTTATAGTDYPYPVAASANLTAQTGAVSSVTTATPGSLGTYRIEAYITVTAVSLDVIQTQVTYTDENGTSQTQTFFPMGLTTAGVSTTGAVAYPPMVIRAGTGSAVIVKTNLTTGTGSISYDVGGAITRISN